jgi:hypothetical protein
MPQKRPQDNPLIVQSDHTLLLDVHAPRADDCRAALIPFAELERSPEHLHTYRLTPLSLWNACAAGFTAAAVNETLAEYARFPVPQPVSIADLRNSAFATATPYTFSFDEPDRGKTLYICPRWENNKGDKGPWGEIVKAIVP